MNAPPVGPGGNKGSNQVQQKSSDVPYAGSIMDDSEAHIKENDRINKVSSSDTAHGGERNKVHQSSA